jgi:hypothetical protein
MSDTKEIEGDVPDDASEFDDVRYLQHNQRFQAAVLRTMDNQIMAIEGKLGEYPRLLFVLVCSIVHVRTQICFSHNS